MTEYSVVALYKFVELDNYTELKMPLLQRCQQLGIKGTLLLAAEGINGTIAGTAQNIDRIITYLKADQRLADVAYKTSFTRELPFYRMKVKLKQEIVTLGIPDVDPNAKTGRYIEPQDWNALISDPEVLVIDTRNDYEISIGTFEHAINPQTENFREFPHYATQHLADHKDKKIALFCTGGIRCEKATSYLVEQGFEHVYHLKGGVLKYLEDIPAEQSLWQGECFVFDNRVAVNQQLEPGSYDQCYGCRRPITDADKASVDYQQGVACPYCASTLSDQKRDSASERQKQIELAKQRNELHMGRLHTPKTNVKT